MRRLIGAGAVVGLAATLTWTLASLPHAAYTIDHAAWRQHGPGTVVRGVYHVHTRRSDGTGTLDSVARAAARAGLDFVVVTDHGDATRPPEPPSIRDGVLVVDGVEISTTGGHYVALDVPAAPYPLAGEPAAVVEDVRRLGGFGVAAHPDSPKLALAWQGWDEPIDAFEWVNADTEWRNESGWRLLQTLVHYPFRRPEALAALFERPGRTLARWDRLSASGRRLVSLGAADAHARLGPGGETAPYEGAIALEVPSYETVFRVFSTSVVLDAPFSGAADADARRLLDGLRAGRTFTTIDALARGGRFEFWATDRAGVHQMGELVEPASPLRFTARAAAPPGAQLRLLGNGRLLAASSGLELVYDVEPGATRGESLVAYRVEVTGVSRTDPQMPWILSNPIFVGRESTRVPDDETARPVSPTDAAPPPDGIGAGQWQVEKDPASTGMVMVPVDAGPDDFTLEFEIARGRSEAWVAAVHPLREGALADERSRVAFRARAERPMRLSVQLRAPSPTRDQRWQRSVYLDSTTRDVSLALADFLPVRSADPDVPRSAATTLLFVVDRTNSAAGAQGRVWVSRLAVRRVER